MSGDKYSIILQPGANAVTFPNPQLDRRERPLDPISKPSEPAEEDGRPRRPDFGSPDKENLLNECERSIQSKPSVIDNGRESSHDGETRGFRSAPG